MNDLNFINPLDSKSIETFLTKNMKKDIQQLEKPMETQAKHTAGPWHIGVRQPSSDKFIYGSKGEEVADCDRKTNFPDENLANARLIAAAPELLEACKNALIDPDDDHARKMIESAIAKAEGKS